MGKCSVLVVVVATALLASAARAQETTEIFIPIGRSPGLSGETTVMGAIVSLDEGSGILKVSSDAGEHTARITAETRLYLDRTEMAAPNELASLADLRAGRRCEIHYVYEGGTRTERAKWIKVRP
jgi:hypothetical protein